MIQSFNILLERVTLRGEEKLIPFEVIDVKLGRYKNQFIHISSTFHYHITIIIITTSSKCTPTKFNRIQMRKIYKIFKSFKYLISLLKRNDKMHCYLIQSNSNSEDLFIRNNISIILLISNEERSKLDEPILIDSNLRRLPNLHPPP